MPRAISQAEKNKAFPDLAKPRFSSRDNFGLRKGPLSLGQPSSLWHPEKQTWFRLESFWGWHRPEQLASTWCWPAVPAPFGLWADSCTASMWVPAPPGEKHEGCCYCLRCKLLEHGVLACSRQPSSSSSTRSKSTGTQKREGKPYSYNTPYGN